MAMETEMEKLIVHEQIKEVNKEREEERLTEEHLEKIYIYIAFKNGLTNKNKFKEREEECLTKDLLK